MRTPTRLLVATALTLAATAVSGCQLFLIGPAGVGRDAIGVFAPEIRYDHDKVHVTIVNPDSTVPIEARLFGPGATAEPLTVTWTCDSFGRNATDCSLPLPDADARAGTYTIELRRASDGLQLTETKFALVAVPGTGGKPALIVDPAKRRGVGYVHEKVFHTWLPIDASYYSRAVTFYLVKNGVLDPKPLDGGMNSTNLEGEGAPAIDLARAAAWLPSPGSQEPDTALQVIAFVGRERVGSWAFRYGQGSVGSLTDTTLEVLGDYTIVEQSPVEPALAAKLGKAQDALVDERMSSSDGMDDKNFEQRVCAVLSDEKALKVATALEDLRKKGKSSSAVQTSVSVGSFSVDTGSTAMMEGFPSWQTGVVGLDRFNRLDLSNGPEEIAYRSKLRELDQLGAKYGDDCMAKILQDVPWALPASSAIARQEKRSGR